MISKLESFINAILEYINKKYEEYRKLLERVNNLWSEYKRAVEELKKRWDIDSALISSRIEELRYELDLAKKLLEELKIKRELDLIDEETYSAGLSTLNEILSKISTVYEDLHKKYEELENQIKEHWIRSIDVMSISPEKIDEIIAQVEEAAKRGEISDLMYERLMRDLQILKRVVQALELLRSGTQVLQTTEQPTG